MLNTLYTNISTASNQPLPNRTMDFQSPLEHQDLQLKKCINALAEYDMEEKKVKAGSTQN